MRWRVFFLLALGLLPLAGCQNLGSSTPSESRFTLRRGGLIVVIETAPQEYLTKFGPRFDRTAVVRQVTLRGREFLGEWGLPDEFGINGDGVLGYCNAPIGGEFVKIGVGRLVRDITNNYTFWQRYPVGKLFAVEASATKKNLSVLQSSDDVLPWRYRYKKTYELVADDVLGIRYQLTNAGTNAWSFEHYNHHWFALDHAPVGPAYALETGFALPTGDTTFTCEGRRLGLRSAVPTNSSCYLAGELIGVTAFQNHFTVRLHDQAKVSFQGDYAPARFAAYAAPEGFCPEVFQRAEVLPGKTVAWSVRYQFVPQQP